MPDPDAPTFGAPPVLDDEVPLDDGPQEPDEERTELDDLEAELGATELPTVTLAVPGRPRYAVVYRLSFTDRDLDTWRRKAKDKRYADGVSGTKFAAILLASTCLRVLRDGETLEVDGKVATFTSRPFLELLKATTAVDGVLKLYGLEGHAQQAAGSVQRAAGWLDPVDEVSSEGELDPS